MADPRPTPITRLRSRHRRFTQQRADRNSLRGSLILDALVVVGAAIWWLSGHWQVAVAWAFAASLAAAFSVWSYRHMSASGGLEERWRLRGFPGPASITAILGLAMVLLITLRFGIGWTWGDASVVPVTSALTSLVFAWLGARRYRKFVAERRSG